MSKGDRPIGHGGFCLCKNCTTQKDMESMVARALRKRPFETFEQLALRLIRTPKVAQWKRRAAHLLLSPGPVEQKVANALLMVLDHVR